MRRIALAVVLAAAPLSVQAKSAHTEQCDAVISAFGYLTQASEDCPLGPSPRLVELARNCSAEYGDKETDYRLAAGVLRYEDMRDKFTPQKLCTFIKATLPSDIIKPRTVNQ